MSSLSGTELRRIERQYADGIKSGAVVEIFRAKGHRFSEATLRKYVQLGLLPKSRRVGARGRHQGSVGLYPVAIIRLVNDIKQALDAGATLEEVRFGCIGLGGELDVLRLSCEEVLLRFQQSVQRVSDVELRNELGKQLVEHRKTVVGSLRELERLALRIGRRPE